MKAKRIISGWIFVMMAMAWSSSMVVAANVQSVKDGNWSDASVWSTGSVPNATDRISIRHRILHNSTLFLQAAGVLTVELNGSLKVLNDLNNTGNVANYDSLTVGGVENFGGIENYGSMVVLGGFENRVAGSVSNYANISLTGDFVNRWKFLNEGYVFMKGDFENIGVTEALGASQGYFQVCGSVKHHTGASVIGLEYLCLICGGSYDTEPGRIGDFTLQCFPFVVSLSDFRAEVVDGSRINLVWTTQSETNSDWFVVERSVPSRAGACKVGKCGQSRDFEEIGRVKAAGNSSSAIDYQYVDARPVAGFNYYRLRIIDRNGAVSYSTVVEAMVVGQGMQLLAYPNPNNSVLHIHATGMSGPPATLTLYSIDGKRVWEQTLDLQETPARFDLQVCDFAAGVYLLKLQQGKEQAVRKLIFEK